MKNYYDFDKIMKRKGAVHSTEMVNRKKRKNQKINLRNPCDWKRCFEPPNRCVQY